MAFVTVSILTGGAWFECSLSLHPGLCLLLSSSLGLSGCHGTQSWCRLCRWLEIWSTEEMSVDINAQRNWCVRVGIFPTFTCSWRVSSNNLIQIFKCFFLDLRVLLSLPFHKHKHNFSGQVDYLPQYIKSPILLWFFPNSWLNSEIAGELERILN